MAGVGLRLVVLKTKELGRLCAFYKAIGIELQEEKHGKGPVHYSGRLGPAVLELYPLDGDAVPDQTTRLGFAVKDLTAVVERLVEGGAEVVSPIKKTEWGTMAVVKDPDGRSLELSHA